MSAAGWQPISTVPKGMAVWVKTNDVSIELGWLTQTGTMFGWTGKTKAIAWQPFTRGEYPWGAFPE